MNASTTRGPYHCLKVIGAGAFGKVYQAKHISAGSIVALKVIDLDTSDNEDIPLIQKEVAVLSQLSNVPNITKYYESFLDGSEVCIAMEYASAGSVYDLMQTLPNRSLEEKPSAFIVREILVALVALHAVPVIHRDIKCANILIGKAGGVMLCDFGVAALLQGGNNRRDTWIGSPYWMAPEIVSGSSSYDVKVDIWSLGVTLYEMIKGAPPLAHLRPEDALERIGKSQPPRLGEEDSSSLLRMFLASCLKESPDERPSADMLMKDKWLAKLKAPNSVLRDLIPASRQSLPSLGSSHETSPESFDRPESWTFSAEDSEEFEDFSDGESEYDNATMHPTLTTPLPRSLKGLFDVEPMNNQIPNSFLTEDANNHSPIVRSGRFPNPIPPPYATSPVYPPPASVPRPTPLASSPLLESMLPPSHPATPPSNHVTPPHLITATTAEKQFGSLSSTATTPTVMQASTPVDINSRQSPVPLPSASSSETTSNDSGSYSQIPSTPSGHLQSPHIQSIQGSEHTNHEFTSGGTARPFSPSSSLLSKALHRTHPITTNTTKRDDPSTWKFPATFNNSKSELPNLGLGHTAAGPSVAIAHQLGIPDLLPPSPLPLGFGKSPILAPDHPGNHPTNSAAQSFTSLSSLPTPINYPALISDPNLMSKEFERVVQDLQGLLQDMYDGLNGVLGDDPIDE